MAFMPVARKQVLAFMPVAQEQGFGLYAGCSGAGFWPLCQLLRSRLLESLTQSISQSASLGVSLSESLSQSVSYSLSHRVSHSECFTQSAFIKRLSSPSVTLRVPLSELLELGLYQRASLRLSFSQSRSHIVSRLESLTPWCSLKEASCFWKNNDSQCLT